MAKLILFATCFFVMVLIFGNVTSKFMSETRSLLTRRSSKSPMMCQIRWLQPVGDWSSTGVELHDNCDFPQNDIAVTYGRPFSQCMSHCKNNPRCTHFTYFPSGLQLCWLKNAKMIPMTKNPKSKCGIFPGRISSKTTNMIGKISNRSKLIEVQFRDNCDFPQNDIDLFSGLSFSECMEHCKEDPRCTHFTSYWGSGSLQVCRLKNAKMIPMTKNSQSRCGFLPGRSHQTCPS